MYVRFYAARVYAVIDDWKRAETNVRACLALGYDRKEIEREPDLKLLRGISNTKDGN
jgi:hypothetical protein